MARVSACRIARIRNAATMVAVEAAAAARLERPVKAVSVKSPARPAAETRSAVMMVAVAMVVVMMVKMKAMMAVCLEVEIRCQFVSHNPYNLFLSHKYYIVNHVLHHHTNHLKDDDTFHYIIL